MCDTIPIVYLSGDSRRIIVRVSSRWATLVYNAPITAWPKGFGGLFFAETNVCNEDWGGELARAFFFRFEGESACGTVFHAFAGGIGKRFFEGFVEGDAHLHGEAALGKG